MQADFKINLVGMDGTSAKDDKGNPLIMSEIVLSALNGHKTDQFIKVYELGKKVSAGVFEIDTTDMDLLETAVKGVQGWTNFAVAQVLIEIKRLRVEEDDKRART